MRPLILLAETDWPELVKNGGTGAVILLLVYGLKLLVAGVFRLEREVKVESARADRESERADREAAARQRIQDAVMNEWTPAVIEARVAMKQLVDAHVQASELQKQLVDAFLYRLRSGQG